MRRAAPRVLATAALLVVWAPALSGQALDEARRARAEGRYDEALRAYAAAARDGGPVVARERARLLAELGRHGQALELLSTDGGATARAPALENVLGEVLAQTGERDRAAAAFRRALEADAPDRNVAALNLALLRWRRGEREEALQAMDAFIDLYNEAAERLTAEELMAVGVAVEHLAVRDPDLVQDALLAYDQAAAAAPDDPRPDVLVGELFLSRYQSPDAHAAFDEVLARNPRHPDAAVGKARALAFDGRSAEAAGAAERALETNPRHVGARTLLARLHIEAGAWDEAEEELDRALQVDPTSLEALSVLGALHYLRYDEAAWARVRDRALALNPRYADLFTTVAELAVDHRRYADAVDLAGRAVRLDSTSWRAFGTLGTNQLRTGRIEEGRRNLERAFEGDPHNVWFYNTLNLLDSFERYETVPTEHFRLVLRGDEAELLAPYVAAVAEEAYAALAARYRAEPPTPIRVEIFPDHEDFSVRTLGLPGLGALGIAFGNTLVMDSPAARPPGEFNWASTLWHEIAHAFHLAMTDHRVPRWFSEGLAVHEQRAAREGWGHQPSVGFLQAYQTGSMPPVSRLDEGFMRPAFPAQVVYSYYMASLVFAWIEEAAGPDAVLDMLRGYRDGRATPDVFREVLGRSPEEVDEDFDRWLRARFESEFRATSPSGETARPDMPLERLRTLARRQPGDFLARLRLGQRLFTEGARDEAEEELRAALRLFPAYGGPDSPLLYLARIHRERGELDRAAAALRSFAAVDEAALEPRTEEAEIRLELGDTAGAVTALREATLVHPYDAEAHERLARLLAADDRPDEAVREWEAVLALDPADRAEAHYRLARARLAAGDREGARSDVLRALEIAPTFEAALELLLELRGGGT